MPKIHITYDGLVAGERYLREHCEEYDDGTFDGFHNRIVKGLISEICRVSGLTLEMNPDNHQSPLVIYAKDYSSNHETWGMCDVS